MLNHKCPGCGKVLKYKESKICRGCYRANPPKGKECPAYIDGRSNPKCVDCGGGVKDANSVRCRGCYNLGRKQSASTKPPKSIRYKTSICMDCGVSIYPGSIRCKPCNYKYRILEKNSNWRGGRIESGKGSYVLIKEPSHPNAIKNGYVPEHRKVMADFLGRALETTEHVHHKDGNKLNNNISNLEILSASEHMKHHMSSKKKFTKEEEGQVSDLFRYGFSTTEIGEMFLVAAPTISRYLKISGLKDEVECRSSMYLTKEEVEEIVVLYEEGFTIRELSEEYGVSVSSVCYHLRKEGVQMKRSHNNGRSKPTN